MTKTCSQCKKEFQSEIEVHFCSVACAEEFLHLRLRTFEETIDAILNDELTDNAVVEHKSE